MFTIVRKTIEIDQARRIGEHSTQIQNCGTVLAMRPQLATPETKIGWNGGITG